MPVVPDSFSRRRPWPFPLVSQSTSQSTSISIAQKWAKYLGKFFLNFGATATRFLNATHCTVCSDRISGCCRGSPKVLGVRKLVPKNQKYFGRSYRSTCISFFKNISEHFWWYFWGCLGWCPSDVRAEKTPRKAPPGVLLENFPAGFLESIRQASWPRVPVGVHFFPFRSSCLSHCSRRQQS